MKRVSVLAALVGAFMSSAAGAAEPLVDAAWVKANAGRPGIVFLDVRSPKQAYLAGHVPGAVHTDYVKDNWRVDKGGVPGMLPDVDKLEALIGRLGVDNETHVVLLPAGASATEMGVATRIYWTFKVLGHDRVSILNGGMAAYPAERASPLQQGDNAPRAKAFKANFRPELLATAEDVKAAKGGLVDHRPADQYLGVNKSAAVKRYGTVPGARSLPAGWTTVDDGGTFRDAAQLKTLFEAAGAPTQGSVINFCNTGHWASVGWFVVHELLGNKQARLYDGSMAEWAKDDANPVERKISLP
jgi:thiosulfate/3-mercaptopyruvate sulfurtransferase